MFSTSAFLLISVTRFSYDNALRWTPWELSDDESTLVQVMVWCRQASSHYLGRCCPSSISPYCVIRSHCVKISTNTTRCFYHRHRQPIQCKVHNVKMKNWLTRKWYHGISCIIIYYLSTSVYSAFLHPGFFYFVCLKSACRGLGIKDVWPHPVEGLQMWFQLWLKQCIYYHLNLKNKTWSIHQHNWHQHAHIIKVHTTPTHQCLIQI